MEKTLPKFATDLDQLIDAHVRAGLEAGTLTPITQAEIDAISEGVSVEDVISGLAYITREACPQ